MGFRKKVLLLALLIIGMFSISACQGNPDVYEGKYTLLLENGDVDQNSYIHIINENTLEFVNVNSDEYVDGFLEDLYSFPVTDDTGVTIERLKEDATEEELTSIREDYKKDLNGELVYHHEQDGNVHNIIVEFKAISISLEYFPDEKKIEFLNQMFICQE